MTVRTPEGTHEEPVPVDKRTAAVITAEQATELARIGTRIEQLYGQPMDIEWALHEGSFFIVQARPITALRGHSPATDEWNDSLTGDYLWTNANLGEAVPDVMTPCTWSLMQVLVFETVPLPALDKYRVMGNIGGRFYMNLSLLASLAAVFGVSRQRFIDLNENFFGRIPNDLEIPLIPFSRWSLLPDTLRLIWHVRVNQKRLPAFFAASSAHCDALHTQIQATSSAADLITLWQADLEPFFRECLRML